MTIAVDWEVKHQTKKNHVRDNRDTAIMNAAFLLFSEYVIATFFITANFFTTLIVFAQMYQFSLNLNSFQ